MKILITADWHLGKKIHSEDLSEDMNLFFEWLLQKIRSEGINYLLVAGDIFDNNNPSNEATKLYFSFLKKLIACECKAIIIAGNHDSPSFIDVPKELLSGLDITVVGIFPGIEKVEQIFLPLIDKNGKEVAVVAAIPFLQDRFVRQVGEGEGATEIAGKITQGIKSLFTQIGSALIQKYPSVPKIGMAHLHAQGTEISEVEREIQIGNQDGIASSSLDQFDYLALGHIHSGQSVVKGKIQYAGSPINLGFTENKYQHKVVLLEIVNNQINESEIQIPKNRSLYQVSGTMTEIETTIMNLKKKYPLQVFLDVKIEEDKFDSTITDRLEILKKNLAIPGDFKIINNRILYKDKSAVRFSSNFNAESLHSLKPENVFKDLIANRGEEEQVKLLEIFSEILSDTTQA